MPTPEGRLCGTSSLPLHPPPSTVLGYAWIAWMHPCPHGSCASRSFREGSVLSSECEFTLIFIIIAVALLVILDATSTLSNQCAIIFMHAIRFTRDRSIFVILLSLGEGANQTEESETFVRNLSRDDPCARVRAEVELGENGEPRSRIPRARIKIQGYR